MQSKAFYTSKTFWVNFLGTLVAIVTASDITPLLPPKALPYITGGIAVANVILRSLKSQQAGSLTLIPQAQPSENLETK